MKEKKPYINTIINKFVYCGCTFLANALITRALGLEFKGEYAWIINLASIISIFAGLGIYQSIPYFKRLRVEKDLPQTYVNIFVTQTIFYILLSVIIIWAKGFDFILLSICLLAITDILSQQLNMLLLVDKIYQRNKIFVFGSYINLLVSGVCLILYRNNLYAAIGCYLIVKIFYIIAYLLALGKVPKCFGFSVKNLLTKVQFGILPMFSFLMITLNYKVDVLMLKSDGSVSPLELSLYTVGVSIAEIAWVIPDGFKEVLFSRTSNKNNDSEVAAAIRVSNAVIVVTIIGVIIFGKLIIGLFFGKDFVDAYKVTVLLFLGIPAMSWFKIIYTLFNAMGRTRLSFGILFACTLSNIVLNLMLIPKWGIYGAAFASVFSYSICGITYLVLFARYSGNKISSLFIMKKRDLRHLIAPKG